MKCVLTLARQVGLVGQGGRGDDGGAARELDLVVVQRQQHAIGWSTVVAAMAGVVASVQLGEESRGREMEWEQQQHVAQFLHFGTVLWGQRRHTSAMWWVHAACGRPQPMADLNQLS